VIQKEKNMTSREVVNQISKKFGIKKVGHTGTLDPLATGVLVLAIGEGTKLVPFLTSDEKEYVAEVLVGIETDTLDVTGKVLKQCQVDLNEEQVAQVIKGFPRQYLQEVPKYSAVHVNGKRLYEYARSEEEVCLPKKEVEIKALELLSFHLTGVDISFTFRCVVSKGTYIRSLIRDIGNMLGVPCTMKNLHRTRQGIFKEEQAKKISEANLSDMLTLSSALSNYPKVILDADKLYKVRNGAKLEGSLEKPTCFVDKEGRLVAIYENAKDFSGIKPMKVFHDE